MIDDALLEFDKPQTKAEQVIAAAHKLFLQKGYGATSMDAIAAEAKVSKRTVYSHFENKEKLFGEIIRSFCTRMGCAFEHQNHLDGEPEKVLRDFASNLLTLIMHPKAIATMRVVLSEVEQFPELASAFWNAGPGPGCEQLAIYLHAMNEQGTLKISNPKRAAAQFVGLIKGPFHDRFLLGLVDDNQRQEAHDSIDDAIRIFLNGTGPMKRM